MNIKVFYKTRKELNTLTGKLLCSKFFNTQNVCSSFQIFLRWLVTGIIRLLYENVFKSFEFNYVNVINVSSFIYIFEINGIIWFYQQPSYFYLLEFLYCILMD